MQTIVIDAGNTRIKMGRFQKGQLTHVQGFDHSELDQLLTEIQYDPAEKLVISSVVAPEISEQLLAIKDCFIVSTKCSLPIKNGYASPETLGMDRLCNAVAVSKRMQSDFAVSIDIGTCIKFDLVGKSEGYLGGSIAPGIELRYKSLHAFTEKLPLLSNKSTTPLVGKDTKTSMQSGVINGMRAEIEGLVSYYESQFHDLTFFMTGGDATFFDIQGKNDIFAVENLTLKGLFEIYKHNA